MFLFRGHGLRFLVTTAALLLAGVVRGQAPPTEYDVSGSGLFAGLPVKPVAITVGPDGAIWFTESLGFSVGRVDPATGAKSYYLLEYDPPCPPGLLCGKGYALTPASIAAGPDGNLWVGADGIYRVTPQGVVTRFALPTYPPLLPVGNSVDNLAWDGADAMWFTEVTSSTVPASHKIGKITFDPGTHLFAGLQDLDLPAGTGNSAPHGIVHGSDGNMWFSDGNQIDRVDQSGQVTAFPLPLLPATTQTGTAEGIAVGPDGRIWLTVSANSPANVGALENLNPSACTPGVCPVSVIPLPSIARRPRGLTFGPDGDIWFVDSSNLVCSIAPDGSGFQMTALATLSDSQRIVAGPAGDNSVWFTESGRDKVGRIGGLASTACVTGPQTLCLQGGRFRVEVAWRVPPQGTSGAGTAIPVTGDTGTFWFFSPNNLELMVKILDGRAINGHWWVFYGALSNVEYTITVADTATGAVEIYRNPYGHQGSNADTSAFSTFERPQEESRVAGAGATFDIIPEWELARSAAVSPAVAPETEAAAAGCTPDGQTLCQNGNRFQVRVVWSVPSQGSSGTGQAVPLTGDTGYFWFFSDNNIELIVKVLDGRSFNNHFWVFYGALSNVQYTITVTDIQTGAIRTYVNPSGTLASVADTRAF